MQKGLDKVIFRVYINGGIHAKEKDKETK